MPLEILFFTNVQQGDPQSPPAEAGCLLELLLCCGLKVLMSLLRLLIRCQGVEHTCLRGEGTCQVSHKPERLEVIRKEGRETGRMHCQESVGSTADIYCSLFTRMWGNQVGDEGAKAFAEALRNHPRLTNVR